MIKGFLLIFQLFLFFQATCQTNNFANVWVFGDNVSLDFNSQPPLAGTGAIDTQEGVATICDAAGNLLFYTDGMSVWDQSNSVTPNGSGLFGHWSSTQSSIIVPHPGNANQYFIFTTEAIDYSSAPRLSYTLYDMSLPGNGSVPLPFGDVVTTEKNVLLAQPVVEKITSVRKCDNTGFWVIAHSLGNNEFLVFDVDVNGVNVTPSIQPIGITHQITNSTYITNGVGCLKSSIDGSKLALVYRDLDGQTSNGGGAYTYDFNNSSGTGGGVISNEQFVPGSGAIQSLYGLEFSPDGNQLYIGDLQTVYRANLSLGTPISSVTQTTSISSNNAIRTLQLGPDENIYVSINNYTFVGQILNPNNTAATFNPQEITLNPGTNGRFGLPNFIPSLYLQPGNLDLGPDTTICVGSSYTLDPGFGYTDYLWSDGSTNQTLQITNSGSYWVVGNYGACQDSVGVNVTFSPLSVDLGPDITFCDSVDLLLSSGSAGNHVWSDNSTGTNLQVNQSGTYWVEITENGCSGSDTINVGMDLTPNFDLGNDTTVCTLPYLLNPSVSAQNYLWNDGSTNQTLSIGSSGIYWLSASNGSCTSIDTIQIDQLGFSVDLGPDTAFCSTINLLLNPNITGNYVWSDNSTGTTLQVDQVGTYWVTVSNANCSSSDTINVYQSSVNAGFSALGGVSCGPIDIPFTDASTSTNGVVTNWSWDFGDGASSVLQNPVHTYAATGVYDVQLAVTNSNGCTDDTVVQIDVTINQPANAAFNYNPSTVMADQQIFFNNLSENAIGGWLWDFGDGTTSSEFEPIYQYEAGGSYEVTLIAFGAFGCNDTLTITIGVVDEILIYVPNAFTPDGDAINNSWNYYISGISEADFRVEVYNRWGEIIWESTDINERWDGTYKGRIVQVGTYTWKIQVQALVNDESREYVGHVSVLY